MELSYVCTMCIFYFPNSVPLPTLTIITNGTQNAGARFEANCFVELPSSDLAPYTTVNYLDGAFNNISERLEETPDARVQLLPTRQYNATHLVRTIILDPLGRDHQGTYYCVVNITVPRAAPSAAVLRVVLEVFRKRSSDVCIIITYEHGEFEVASAYFYLCSKWHWR